MRLLVRQFGVAAGAAMLLATTAMVAEAAYPDKPITMIVPFGGGSGELFTRQIAQALKDRLGQPVLVETRPGAAGNVGTAALARSKPDGYTLVFGASNIVINPHISKVQYDTFKDLAPVARLIEYSPVIVINPSIPAKTLPELIAWTRQQPGGANYSFGGVNNQLVMDHLAKVSGGKLNAIPYRGEADMIRAVMANEIPISPTTLTSAAGQLQAGTIRPIAMASAKRISSYPDIPTIAESYPEYGSFSSWFSFLAPAGTPKEIVDLLNKTMNEAVQSAELKPKLIESGYEILNNTPEEFAAFIRREYDRMAKLIKDYNINDH